MAKRKAKLVKQSASIQRVLDFAKDYSSSELRAIIASKNVSEIKRYLKNPNVADKTALGYQRWAKTFDATITNPTKQEEKFLASKKRTPSFSKANIDARFLMYQKNSVKTLNDTKFDNKQVVSFTQSDFYTSSKKDMLDKLDIMNDIIHTNKNLKNENYRIFIKFITTKNEEKWVSSGIDSIAQANIMIQSILNSISSKTNLYNGVKEKYKIKEYAKIEIKVI